MLPAEPCRPLFFAAALLLVGVADAQGPDDGGRVGIAAAIAGGAVVVIASAVAAYLFVRRRRRQRVQTMKTEEEMVRVLQPERRPCSKMVPRLSPRHECSPRLAATQGVYERQQEVERAARALQRAREVRALPIGVPNTQVPQWVTQRLCPTGARATYRPSGLESAAGSEKRGGSADGRR